MGQDSKNENYNRKQRSRRNNEICVESTGESKDRNADHQDSSSRMKETKQRNQRRTNNGRKKIDDENDGALHRGLNGLRG